METTTLVKAVEVTEKTVSTPLLMTRARRRFYNVLKNRKGQSTTEYILILAIVVMIASKLKTSLTKLIATDAMGKIEGQLNTFDAGN